MSVLHDSIHGTLKEKQKITINEKLMNFIQLIHIPHLFYTSFYYRSGRFVLERTKIITIAILF